jgi:hypothetical protein
MDDGQPLAPFIDDGVVWHLVRRTDGRTLWRRLFFRSSSVITPWRSVAGRSNTSVERKDLAMAMDMRSFGGETFLGVDDVKGGALVEMIAVVKLGKWDKPNLVFESGSLLSLNATNRKTLIKCWGPNSDDWLGREIRLVLGQVKNKDGELQDGVVVEPISAALPRDQQTKLQPEQKPEAKPAQRRPAAPKHDPGHPFNNRVDDLG